MNPENDELTFLGFSDDPSVVSGWGGNYESFSLFCDNEGSYFLEVKGKYGCFGLIEISKEKAKKIYAYITESDIEN